MENVECISPGVRMAMDAFISPFQADIFPGPWFRGSSCKGHGVDVFYCLDHGCLK